MTSNVILLSFFLLGLFLVLTLIALNIDLLNRYFSKEDILQSKKDISFETYIDNISKEINSHVLTEVLATKIMSACPVEAFTIETSPEIHLVISENKCLGYACLQCLQEIISAKL